MNKQTLKQHFVELQNQVILNTKDKLSSVMSMADIDESDTIDPEDFSHQAEATEMKLLFTEKLSRAENELRQLENLDVSGKSKVEPGALVITDELTFFIGHAAMPSDFDGMRVVGISTDSPIYSVMSNKTEGDSFEYADNKYKIKGIY